MAEIGRWNGHVFEVSPGLIRSFSDLTMKGASETEDKVSAGTQYVKRKNSKPKEMSLTVVLRSNLGCDVFAEAQAFVDEACAGATDYFYVGAKKAATCSLMLVEASVEEIVLGVSGAWHSANVALKFKQASKNDGATDSTASSGKKSKKSSAKSTATKKSSTTKTGTIASVAEKLVTALKTQKKTQTIAQRVSEKSKAKKKTKSSGRAER